MEVTVIASGSKGNCTLIKTSNKNILIDAGITASAIKKRIGAVPKIDLLLLTHLHIDHIAGLSSIAKKIKCPICTPITDIKNLTSLPVFNESIYQDKDLEITFFPLSHDVECYGILIKDASKELVYITDTGYLSLKNLKFIKNKDMYIIESNHDINKLMNGSYPFYLKQRILGDSGHLSNSSTAQYIKKIVGNRTKNIILAHLSEENNTEELAYEEVSKVINDQVVLHIAKQHEALELIEV